MEEQLKLVCWKNIATEQALAQGIEVVLYQQPSIS